MTSPWKDHIVYTGEPEIYNSGSVNLRQYNLDPLIDAYTSRGIVVVIDIHDLIGRFFEGEELTDYLQFLTQLTEAYKYNPYLWIDIHNEPGSWEGRTGEFGAWPNQ